jgi:S-adenosylhomocysteine hydrolase
VNLGNAMGHPSFVMSASFLQEYEALFTLDQPEGVPPRQVRSVDSR